MKIKKILKLNGIKKNAFAKRLFISRPTLDLYIEKYEKGEIIPNAFYNNLFHNLFDSDKSEEELKQAIDSIPAIKTKVVKFDVKLKNNIDYYEFKQMLTNIRRELDCLEQSLDLIYKEELELL